MIRYFGLGLSRTGTTSLYTAMARLGFRSYHFMNPQVWEKLDDYEFVNDLPGPSRFEELDKRYPGSKFIYNVRDVESWLVSCENLEKRLLKASGGKHYPWMEDYQVEIYGTPYFDESLFRQAHARHDEHVREYFQDRPDDLLIMDIINGDGYDKLIPFIGWENIRFPWTNSTKDPNRPF